MRNDKPFIYTDFFTTGKGLTSTSANHLANLAKQAYTEDEAFLNSCSFVNQDYTIIGDTTKTPISIGMSEDDLKMIAKKLERIAALKGFCAWVREAISEKERYCRVVGSLKPMNEWADENGYTVPVSPGGTTVKPNEYNLSVAEKADYLCEEAAAATYGSFIHPGGPGYNAYKNLVDKVHNPCNVNENGRDTIIRTFTASVEPSVVNDEFNHIRDTWRAHEARVNKQKHENETIDTNAEIATSTQCNIEREAYETKMIQLRKEYEIYLQSERKRIQDMRIVIPNRLMPIYDELRLMGKE